MKTLGMLLVFLSVSSYGFFISHESKKETNQLNEMLDFMNHIKNQIKYFNKPLCEIYADFSSQNNVIKRLSESLCSMEWNEVFENNEDIVISKNAQGILIDFGNKLGKCDYNGQMEICDYYITAFEKEVSRVKNEQPKKTKLYVSISIYIALLLILILW